MSNETFLPATVTMELAEYNKLIATIENQKAMLSKFDSDSRVLLIERRNSPAWWRGWQIPQIIGDEKVAKQFLKDEFDYLEKQYNALVERMEKSEYEEDKSKFRKFLDLFTNNKTK